MEKVKIYTRLLRTGQIIASAAFDSNGLLLIGEGTEVNEKNIYLLKMSGIEYVEVRKEDAFKWQLFQSPQEKRKAIAEKFNKFDSKYMDIIKKSLTEKIQNKEKEGEVK